MASPSQSRSRSPSHSPAPHRRTDSRSHTPPPGPSSRRRGSPSQSQSPPARGGSGDRSRRNGYDRERRSSYDRERRSSYDRDRRRQRSRSPMSSRRRHMGTREDPTESKCIGVFGLSIYTTQKELQRIFEKYGELERVQVVVDAKTGRSRGFAFVYFTNLKDATSAKNECSGMEIDGRRIRVDFSITQRPHTPTPGIYMGRPTTVGRDYGGYGRGGGYRGERYRSPSPRYRSSRRRGDPYGGRGDYDG